ncbi:MAG: hypothetical protein AB7G11_05175 [Phycisphaerales bacterium]
MRELAPNIAATMLLTPATGGAAIPLVAAVWLATHLGLNIKKRREDQGYATDVFAALDVLRRRAARGACALEEIKGELAEHEAELSLGLDEVRSRLEGLKGLATTQRKDDAAMKEYLRDNQRLLVSLGRLLEESFDELRAEVGALPVSVVELRASMHALYNELGVTIDTLTVGQVALADRVDALRDGQAGLHAKADTHAAKLDQILEYIGGLKRPGVDPTRERPPPDLIAAAEELMESRDGRERAQAAIVLKKWEEWRREIEALSATRAMEEVFQNKMIEGDGYYAQGMFDEAIGPYEVAFRLREGDVKARGNLAIGLSQARRGNVGDRQRRAIEIHEGTLSLPGLTRSELGAAQNGLAIAWAEMPIGEREQNLAKAIKVFEANLSVYTREADPTNWAMTQHNLGNVWQDMPTGNRAENIGKAIAAYEAALTIRTREAAPQDWAATQNGVACAWTNMPTGDVSENVMKGIRAYEAALTVRTREAAPFDWAMTQHNLGTAWRRVRTGERGKNLARAIAAYESAVTVRTRDAAPFAWATTQNDLGLAWSEMPTGDRTGNLTRAISSYRSALSVRTREAAPFDWAATQNNLGIALAAMPTGDRAENLTKAMEAYTAAETVLTREAAPFDWAMIQNNLGNAWLSMPARGADEKARHLTKAIAAYTAALTVRTREAAPFDWAQTQNNVGEAWRSMPAGDKRENLAKAMTAFMAALTVCTREADSYQWAMTQHNLGRAWSEMPTGDRVENLRKAIEAYTSALTIRTREAAPFDWAMTQHNLAIEYAEQARISGEDGCGLLRRAIMAGKGALIVRTGEAMPREHGETAHNLAIFRRRYEALGGDRPPTGVAFEDIPAAL